MQKADEEEKGRKVVFVHSGHYDSRFGGAECHVTSESMKPAIYHVINRDNARRIVFLKYEYYEAFIRGLP
jgi:hypothetical protein